MLSGGSHHAVVIGFNPNLGNIDHPLSGCPVMFSAVKWNTISKLSSLFMTITLLMYRFCCVHFFHVTVYSQSLRVNMITGIFLGHTGKFF